MAKKLNYEAKEKMVALSGACFWYWNSFYSFLDSCGVPKTVQKRYPRDAYNKYQMMRSILGDLEQADNLELINSIASAFYRLKAPIDRDNLDQKKAKGLLEEFRDAIGDDPIDAEVQKIEREWTKDPTQQGDLSIFDGKIRGKAQSTRGFFISANGFDENAITKFSGDAPRIVLMTGEDVALVLGGQVLFADAMKAKIDAIVRYGNILFPLRKIAT